MLPQRKVESKEIGGYTFTVQALNVAKGREAFVRLQRLLGPALGELLADQGLRGAGRALAGLSQQLTTADLEWACQLFGEHTTVGQGDSVLPLDARTQDALFAGRYTLMFEWLEFAIEVNFADFLEKVRSLTSSAAPAAPKAPASQSPTA